MRLSSLAAGLIPAHAGKTPRGPTSGRYSGAHPRSRGENSRRRPAATSIRGSSPLTRGKRLNRFAVFVDQGLIPAHAGKTIRGHARASPPEAHPRSRGENPPADSTTSGAGRLIPAHAGKTRTPACSTSRKRAHPRSRGENRPRTENSKSVVGSSPLTRGKHDDTLNDRESVGLIPAHAGKT